jgi:hypothetical protein
VLLAKLVAGAAMPTASTAAAVSTPHVRRRKEADEAHGKPARRRRQN